MSGPYGAGWGGDPPTSDNLLLSDPNPSPSIQKFEDVGKFPSLPPCDDHLVQSFLEAARAANTRRAYTSDLQHFRGWGGSIPSSDESIARYIAAHAHLLKPSTLARRLAAISAEHRALRLSDPCRSELVRLTLRGIRRTYAIPQRRVGALTSERLRSVLENMGTTLQDVRDRAILLIGFAGAFRRSELCGLSYESVEVETYGLTVAVGRTKTDQEGKGRKLTIAHDGGSLCPVDAFVRWTTKSGLATGPVFRPLGSDGKPRAQFLTPEAVARIIKRRVAAAGLNPALYSGHSIRAGYVTSAINARLPLPEILARTGHCSISMLTRYFREAGNAS